MRIYSPNELAEIAERQARLRAAENLIRIVDSKDTYTGEHSQAVAARRGDARELDLDDETTEQLKLAALLHDLGKIADPGHALEEAGLPGARRAAARPRPRPVRALAARGLGIEPVDSWVLHHHEHWDGSGYPNGLAGEEIPSARA